MGNRLGLVVHWFGFLFVLKELLEEIMVFTNEANYTGETVGTFIGGVLGLLVIYSIFYVLQWIFSGNKHPLPWRRDQ